MSTPYIGTPLEVGDRIRFLHNVSLEYARKYRTYTVTRISQRGPTLDSGFLLYGEGAMTQHVEGKTWERVHKELV